jgi:cold-inducible RNA-binding protein
MLPPAGSFLDRCYKELGTIEYKEAISMANKTLYIGNLPYSATEGQLSSHFAAYGATKVRIVEGRGFGFVDIDGDQLETAIADKHMSVLDGRNLTVNEAKPREPRDSGGGGGGNRDSYGGGSSRGSRW